MTELLEIIAKVGIAYLAIGTVFGLLILGVAIAIIIKIFKEWE